MSHFALAALVLGVIVWASLRVEDFAKKVGLFILLGIAACVYLVLLGGEHGGEIVWDVYAVDYPQFIGIPLVTVSIASLRLFSQKLPKDIQIGWFLAIILPIVGNFGTTWAVTPVALSLIPYLKREYPERWVLITITVFVFSANFLAAGTLLADPPQSYWAIRAARDGNPLGFFFPFSEFWVYLLITWVLYVAVLIHLGARFGSPLRGLRLFPASWPKFALGLAFAATIGLTLSFASGYWTTVVLGCALIVALLLAKFAFGEEECHDTLHWTAETAATFIAFFAVVALAHAGMAQIKVPDEGMIAAVAIMTMGADNAAAFAAGYAQFVGRPVDVMVWYNLFNSIAYGGMTPLGNGPQITLFLVILVGMRHLRPDRVFDEWLRMAAVLAPYLLIWTLGAYRLVAAGLTPTPTDLVVVGGIALVVALVWMDVGTRFVPYLDMVRRHGRPSRRGR